MTKKFGSSLCERCTNLVRASATSCSFCLVSLPLDGRNGLSLTWCDGFNEVQEART